MSYMKQWLHLQQNFVENCMTYAQESTQLRIAFLHVPQINLYCACQTVSSLSSQLPCNVKRGYHNREWQACQR